MTNPEYFITHFIDGDIPAGTRIEKWPMHLTVVPPFSIDAPANEDSVLHTIESEGQAVGPIKLRPQGVINPGAFILVPGEVERFGPEEKPEEMIDAVTIVDPTEKIQLLHSRLLSAIGEVGCHFINLNPEWSGKNYSPHVTMKSGRRLNRPFIITTLSLGRKDSDGKTIVGTVDMYNQSVL